MRELGQLMTGAAALAGLAGTVALWAVRRIVRDEVAHALHVSLNPLRLDLGHLHEEVEKLRFWFADRKRGWNESPRKNKEKNNHEDLA